MAVTNSPIEPSLLDLVRSYAADIVATVFYPPLVLIAIAVIVVTAS